MLPVLGLLLLFACITDLRERRIKNALVLSGLAVALVGQLLPGVLAGEPMQALRALGVWSGGAVTGLVIFLPLYLLRAVGAGDVKLLAMVGSFLGYGATVQAGLWSAVAGGAIALVCMLRPSVARQVVGNLGTLWGHLKASGPIWSAAGSAPSPIQRTAVRIPFALAITAGTALSLYLSGRA